VIYLASAILLGIAMLSTAFNPAVASTIGYYSLGGIITLLGLQFAAKLK
jgi:hypothetical protein